MFSNIIEVYYATCHFWVNHLSQVLRVARETREPLNPSLLKSGFLVVGVKINTIHALINTIQAQINTMHAQINTIQEQINTIRA